MDYDALSAGMEAAFAAAEAASGGANADGETVATATVQWHVRKTA